MIVDLLDASGEVASNSLELLAAHNPSRLDILQHNALHDRKFKATSHAASRNIASQALRPQDLRGRAFRG